MANILSVSENKDHEQHISIVNSTIGNSTSSTSIKLQLVIDAKP